MYIRRLLSLILMITITLMLSSCGDDSTSPGEESPFKGTWNFSIDGDAYGSGSNVISENGTFSFNLTFNKSGDLYQQTISGTVSNSGNISATVNYQNNKIGTITGILSGDAGSGVWNTNLAGNGTWVAEKVNTSGVIK